jgi:hypothetical protein
MIANADISDPRIFGRQISAYSALWKYMKNEPEMISMISKALNGLDLPYPPDAPRGVKRTYKAVRARAGQSLIYFSTHCPDAIMGGFEELWEHYSRGIEEVDMPQRSALVLLTVLFIVKYSLDWGLIVVIERIMRVCCRNGREGSIELWGNLSNGGILDWRRFLGDLILRGLLNSLEQIV